MYRLNNDIIEVLEAKSLKGPIPGIVIILCCRTRAGGKARLVTTQVGPFECPRCGTTHEITKTMLATGVLSRAT